MFNNSVTTSKKTRYRLRSAVFKDFQEEVVCMCPDTARTWGLSWVRNGRDLEWSLLASSVLLSLARTQINLLRDNVAVATWAYISKTRPFHIEALWHSLLLSFCGYTLWVQNYANNLNFVENIFFNFNGFKFIYTARNFENSWQVAR
jgi:hypothetical protein